MKDAAGIFSTGINAINIQDVTLAKMRLPDQSSPVLSKMTGIVLPGFMRFYYGFNMNGT